MSLIEIVEQTTTVEVVTEVDVEVVTQAIDVVLAPVETSVSLGPQIQVVEVTTPGPQGPAGPVGGTFVHDQAVASTVWSIQHGLGFFPNVTVIDSSGSHLEGEIAYDSPDHITLTFTSAFSGTAYLS